MAEESLSKTERLASDIRVPLLHFHFNLPRANYVGPQSFMQRSAALLLLKVCRTKVIIRKRIPDRINRSDDV